MTSTGRAAAKLRLSSESSENLNFLSRRLGLRRNIMCRIAIGRSLRTPGSVSIKEPENDDGFEFNRYTLTGEHDSVFKALIVQDIGEKLTDQEYFQTYLRNYIEQGIATLYEEYQKINSPVEFLVGLAGAK